MLRRTRVKFAERCLRVDLGDEERHPARGEVPKICGYRLAFLRGSPIR
jgi:hypothetical protein